MKIAALFILVLFSVVSFAQEQTVVPVIGHRFKVDFDRYAFQLYFKSDTELTIALLNGSKPGNEQSVSISKTEIRPNVYMVTWQEKSGTTVTDMQDFENGTVYANITEPNNHFEHWNGTLTPLDQDTTIKNPSDAQTFMKRNKEMVKSLLNRAFNEKNVQAAAEMITDRYIQHNPSVPTGKAGFIQAISELIKHFPDTKWELKRIWADGDYVITQSHYQFSNKGNGYAVVDIFKIKSDKVDEHWDVVQEIPDKSANDNTMF